MEITSTQNSQEELSLKERLEIAAGIIQDHRQKKEGRGRPAGPSPFNDFHHEICRLIALGWRSSQIEEYLNVTNPTINKVKSSPIGRALIQSLRAGRDLAVVDISEGIKKLEPIALNVLKDAMLEEDVPWSTKSNVALKVIGEIGGHAAPKKIQVAHAILTPEMLDQLREDGKKAGISIYKSEDESLSMKDESLDFFKRKEAVEIEEVEFSILEEGDILT